MSRLTSSAPLSLSAIAAEFGASSLGDAGNAVKAGTGSVSISSFLGDGLSLSNLSFSETTTNGTTSESGIQIGSNGDIYEILSGSLKSKGDWILPSATGIGAEYQVKASISGGSVTGDSTSTWHSLSSDKSWKVSQSTDGTSSATIIVSIRRAGTTTTLASMTVNLSASYEEPVSIVLTNQSVSDFAVEMGSVEAGIEFNSNGQLYGRCLAQNDLTFSGEWMDPAGAVSSSGYSVKATLSSGTTPQGPTLGSWHSLGTTREWSVGTSSGTVSCDLYCEIKNSVGTVIASGTMSLSASINQ